jgi:23S rRNA (uracil1939-C5)-methyltransferase
VRDLERLRDVYRIDAVQPVDMFPHTPHVENVVRLTARRERGEG